MTNYRKYRKLLIGALLAMSCLLPLAKADAQHITVAIGDRPYYTRGASYWNNDVHYVWAPGHWRSTYRGRVWVRGHYIATEHRNSLRRIEKRHRIHRSMMFGGSY